MPAALGHSGEGAECPLLWGGLGLLGYGFLGQTEVFPGILCAMAGGGSEQIWVWREIPVWAAVDSKHKSDPVH